MPPIDAGNLGSMGEQGWLARVQSAFRSLPSSHLLVPVGDDAAVVSQADGSGLILTTDVQVEGTHFRREWLGWRGWAARSLLAAASDIAAMGGTPIGFAVSFGAPPDVRTADLDHFLLGLAETAERYSLASLGGDTVRSERIFADLVVLGSAAPGTVVRQTGALPGDAAWVTGTLGAGYAELLEPSTIHLDDGVWIPPARWPVLPLLRRALPVRALTDLSDGLARDLGKILREGWGVTLEVDAIPLGPSVAAKAERAGLTAWECGYLGGEDFELLVVEEGNSMLPSPIDLDGVPLTRIGWVEEAGRGVRLIQDGVEVSVRGKPFDHFI